MPYRQEDAEAELILEYKGIKVYRVYRNDNIDEGPRDFNFDTRINSTEFESYSIVALADKMHLFRPRWGSSDEEKREILRRAIDAGLVVDRETES